MDQISIEKDKRKRSARNKCFKCSHEYVPKKMKRMKTRKERSLRWHSGVDHPNVKLHHHDGHRNSQDFFHNCCQSRCHCSSQKEFSSVAMATKEPSLITANRLIGQPSGFNHEVKSVDIERLLAENMRMTNDRRKETTKGCMLNLLPLKPRSPSVGVSDLPASDDGGIVPFKKQLHPSAESHDDCQETVGETPATQQESNNEMLGEKRNENPEPSSEADVYLQFEHETKEKAEKIIKSLSVPESQPTPSCLNEDAMTRRINVTPASTENISKVTSRPVQKINSGPRLINPDNSSLSEKGSNRNDQLSECVRAAVGRLCGTCHFPLLKRRDLEAESRANLMKALQERHGPHLYENLRKLQRCFKYGHEHGGFSQNSSQGRATRNEYELQPKDQLSTQAVCGSIPQTFLGSREKGTFKIKEKQKDNWKRSSSQGSKKMAGWLFSKDAPASEDLFRKSPPQFHFSFDPLSSTSDQPFKISPNSPMAQKTFEFDNMDVWPKVPQMSQSNICFINNKRSPLGGRFRVQPPSTEPTIPTLEYSNYPSDYRTDLWQLFPSSKPIFANSFSTQQSGIRQTSGHSILSSKESHMFPSSHMFENVSSLTSPLSPEPWPFPPMRLY